jgi:hypothetical protein
MTEIRVFLGVVLILLLLAAANSWRYILSKPARQKLPKIEVTLGLRTEKQAEQGALAGSLFGAIVFTIAFLYVLIKAMKYL